MSEQLKNILLILCLFNLLGYAVLLGFQIREYCRDMKRLKQLEKN